MQSGAENKPTAVVERKIDANPGGVVLLVLLHDDDENDDDDDDELARVMSEQAQIGRAHV